MHGSSVSRYISSKSTFLKLSHHIMPTVKFAIPKGSIEEVTFNLLEQAWQHVSGRGRTYRVKLGDPDIDVKILRPQEIPTYVQEGFYDVGITGKDWILEAKADVEVLLDLEIGRVKQVIAAPISFPFNNLSDMMADFAKNDKTLRISSEYLTTTSAHIKANAVYKKYYGNADPMIITPWMRLGENRKALKDPAKREKIADMMALLRGVVEGRKKLHIFVNVRKEKLERLLKELPALKRPTVSPLSEEGWYGVNTVIDKNEFIMIVPKLRKLAQGLVVLEPRQILPLDEINLDGYS